METIDIMLELAEKGGLFDKVKVTTTSLSKKLNISQQTISNELRRLQKEGLITRQPVNLGIMIKLTEDGKEYLCNYRKRLNIISRNVSTMKGKVITGMGEGRFYVSQNKYKKQFIEKLDIDPYPGTLNIKIDPALKNQFLSNKKPVIIEGYSTKNRTFGDILCYPIKINDIDAAIAIPKRTHHDENIIEIISKEFLREKLGLKDKDEVDIHER